MAQLALYGKLYGRFDVRIIKSTIDSELISAAFALLKSKDEDAKEDFIDALPQNISTLKYGLLSAIVFNSENGVNKALKQWKKVGKFGLIGEEFSVGIATTIDEAKLEFVAVDI